MLAIHASATGLLEMADPPPAPLTQTLITHVSCPGECRQTSCSYYAPRIWQILGAPQRSHDLRGADGLINIGRFPSRLSRRNLRNIAIHSRVGPGAWPRKDLFHNAIGGLSPPAFASSMSSARTKSRACSGLSDYPGPAGPITPSSRTRFRRAFAKCAQGSPATRTDSLVMAKPSHELGHFSLASG
jgi:hypothetical protein